MKHLHIASEPKDFIIPPDLITQTAAILARKRVVKIYTASVVAEEFCRAKLPFVVLDPTGAWWGLRASPDGKAAGYPVIIIGWAHIVNNAACQHPEVNFHNERQDEEGR